MRMLSSTSRPLEGGFASEKARLYSPPSRKKLTYCPAWKCIGSSVSMNTALIVGVSASIRVTVPGKSRTGMASASASSSISASIVTSDSSRAQQASVLPSSRSKSISAKLEASP